MQAGSVQELFFSYFVDCSCFPENQDICTFCRPVCTVPARINIDPNPGLIKGKCEFFLKFRLDFFVFRVT